MSDKDTTLMLLIAKASRKLHKNSPRHERVKSWLRECAAPRKSAYGSSDNLTAVPYWCLLMEHQSEDEESVFLVSFFDNTAVRVAAGRGETEAVRALAVSEFPDDPSDIISVASERFAMQDKQLTLGRQELADWVEHSQAESSYYESTYSSLARPSESQSGEPPSGEIDAAVMALVDTASSGNETNTLSLSGIKQWIPELLQEHAEETRRFPAERDQPYRDLLAADGSYDEAAVFVMILFDADSVRLVAGRGEVYAVREFGEDEGFPEENDRVIELARRRFDVAEGEVCLSVSQVNNWLDLDVP